MDVDTSKTTTCSEEIRSPDGKVYTESELDLDYLDRLERPETKEEFAEWMDKYMYVQEMPIKKATVVYQSDDFESVTLTLMDDVDPKTESQRQVVTNRRFIRKCETLRIMYEDLKSESGEYPEEAIPIANVSLEVINHMITYCKWRDDNPPCYVHPYKENPPNAYVDIEKYNDEFFYAMGDPNSRKGKQEWFPILAACMYLDCKEMQRAVAEKLAHHIKGRMPDEVCEEFGEDPNNVPEKVKQAILDNNLFCEERDD